MIPIDAGGEFLDLLVGALPGGKGAGEESASLFSEDQDTAAAIFGIALNFEEAAALEWLQCSSEGSAIHREQRSDGSHRRGLGAIERHQQRELTIGEFEWTKFFVEAAGESACCTLDMQAKTAVFDHQRCDEWQRVCA